MRKAARGALDSSECGTGLRGSPPAVMLSRRGASWPLAALGGGKVLGRRGRGAVWGGGVGAVRACGLAEANDARRAELAPSVWWLRIGGVVKELILRVVLATDRRREYSAGTGW